MIKRVEVLLAGAINNFKSKSGHGVLCARKKKLNRCEDPMTKIGIYRLQTQMSFVQQQNIPDYRKYNGT